MNVLLLEDEVPAARRLTRLLREQVADIQIGPVLESVTQAVAYLQTQPHPDLLFSDIHLSDGLGFDVFRQIEPRCPIIFTTAYDEYALRAFTLNAIDYLLKPIVPDELRRALAKYEKAVPKTPVLVDYQQLWQALSQARRTYRQRFLLTYRDSFLTVTTTEVAYFWLENRVTRLVRHDTNWFPVPETIDELSDQLDPRHFFRVSRQCIVSVGCIKDIRRHFNGRLKIDIHPPVKDDLFISRDRTDAFKAWLNQ
ncbi:MAG: response regulator transcription factor [Bacteroidetes bacterium]|nr:response regulator transcription factor [Fibrella sp.]